MINNFKILGCKYIAFLRNKKMFVKIIFKKVNIWENGRIFVREVCENYTQMQKNEKL